MAAATDIQFFSHLNAGCPQLTNNWGCMISLLDACLVNGVSLPNVSSVTVATGGNITVNFASAHSVLLFQCVTLAGFAPSVLNGKYRVIGVPSTIQLTLSSDLSAQSATAMGTAKLSPLGYQIIFSAAAKRVYRALNPTAQHPYIRVDESLSSADGITGVYTSTYGKSAMVGLVENMTNIDDYLDTGKLQLPLDTTNFSKNWTISGTGTNVIRGWAKWYWANGSSTPNNSNLESYVPATGTRSFTLIGDSDAFYLQLNPANQNANKLLMGCGLYTSCLQTDIVPNWFLMATLKNSTAGDVSSQNCTPVLQYGSTPLVSNQISNMFFTPNYKIASKIINHSNTYGITPNTASGIATLYLNNTAALEIPFYESGGYLKGNLKHICFSGINLSAYTATTPLLSDKSMYVADSVHTFNGNNIVGGFYFYLGEMS
ncbi:hypothetical protein [Acinetobacter sp. ANC 4640]